MRTNKSELVNSIGSRPCPIFQRGEEIQYRWIGLPTSLGLYSASISADCRIELACVPAAGNRWDTDLNNRGSNGNYWSGTQDASNENNAYNLYFNSDDANTNNNNRNNGQSVRPVSSTYHL